jgi:hypothetical protein
MPSAASLCDPAPALVQEDATETVCNAYHGELQMSPTRRVTIHGHLIEEFHWHDCPVCYVDANRVSNSFDHAVTDLEAAESYLGIEAITPLFSSAATV